MKAKPLWALWCPPRTTCAIVASTGYITGYEEVPVGVLSARGRGLGKPRVVAGRARFHEFDFTLCVVNREAGGARTGIRILWNAGKVWPDRARLAALEKEYPALRALVLSGTATTAQKRRAKEVLAELNLLRAVEENVRPYPLDWYSRAMPRLRSDSC